MSVPMRKLTTGRRFKQLLGKRNKNEKHDSHGATAVPSFPALTEITVSHETSVSSKPRSIQESSPRVSSESSQLSSINGDHSRTPTTSSSISIHTPPNELEEFVKVREQEDDSIMPPLIRVHSDESDINSIYSRDRDQTSVYYPSPPKSRPLALIRKASMQSQQSDTSNYSDISANRSFISAASPSPLTGQLSTVDLQDAAVDDVLDDISPGFTEREAEKGSDAAASEPDSLLLPIDSLRASDVIDDDASFIEMMSYSKSLSEQLSLSRFEPAPIEDSNLDDPVFAAVRAFQDAGRELDNDMYDSDTSSLQDSVPSSPMFSYHSRHTSHSSMTPMTPFTPTFEASFTIKRPNVTSITTIARRSVDSVDSIDSYVQNEHVFEQDNKAVKVAESVNKKEEDPIIAEQKDAAPYVRTSLDYDEIIKQHLTARSKATPTHFISAEEDDSAPQEIEPTRDFTRRQSSPNASPRPSTMFIPAVEKRIAPRSKEAEDVADVVSSPSLSPQGKRSWSSKMRSNFSSSPLLKML